MMAVAGSQFVADSIENTSVRPLETNTLKIESAQVLYETESKLAQDAEEKLIQEQLEKEREIQSSYQKNTFIIPSCAKWFEFSSIH